MSLLALLGSFSSKSEHLKNMIYIIVQLTQSVLATEIFLFLRS